MNLRVIVLASSVALNAAFAVTLTLRPALAPPMIRDFFGLGASSAEADPARQQREAARAAANAERAAARAAGNQAKLWSALHSTELTTLAAQLRAAGFPATVIRSIIDAEIEARFAPRLKALASSVHETPYWRGDPGSFTGNQKYYDELNQIYRERSRLLRSVLGQDAFAWAGTDPTAAQRRQYGELSPAKIDLVQRIADDYAEMTNQVRSAMQGITLPEDREKLALLEREKHADLAAILSPQELSDYEMRTSTATNRLRTSLSIMDASEAEFRAIYQAQQPYADLLYPTGSVITMEMSERRREATKQANDAIKAALGDERFAQYLRASNSEFQQLYRLGQQQNVSYDTLARAFDLRGPTAEASMKIYSDSSLNTDAKRAALKTLADTTRTQILSTLGPGVGPNYVENARWLAQIEQGAAVTFNPDGGTSYRRLPPAQPPGSALPKN